MPERSARPAGAPAAGQPGPPPKTVPANVPVEILPVGTLPVGTPPVETRPSAQPAAQPAVETGADRSAAAPGGAKPTQSLTIQAAQARGAVTLRPAPGAMTLAPRRAALAASTDPASSGVPAPGPTSESGGMGAVFAADPAKVSEGANHLNKISDLVGDIFNGLRAVTIDAEGDGPIAKAIRDNYDPAAESSAEFVGDLAKLLAFNAAQTVDLSRLLHNVDVSASDTAAASRRR
jgi:hypothetical protein